MRILLIGATGQIGYSLVKALAQTSDQITVLVRDRTRRSFPETVRVLESCSFNPQAFSSALSDVDHVIYALGLPEQYLPDTDVFAQVNIALFKAFLDEMMRAGPSALTYISTCEVFQTINGVIRETHPVASEHGFSPYFQSMIRAYQLVKDYAARHHMHLVTIHPAAVYGGLNTGEGLTNYIENLLNRRFWRVPFVFDGRFPVVHTDSLAQAVIASMHGNGAYIVSEQMTTLKSIAMVLRQHAECYVPFNAPVKMARAGATLLEWVSKVARIRPIMARVQIDFITKGIEPIPDRITHELCWNPRTLDEGLVKYLEMRPTDYADPQTA